MQSKYTADMSSRAESPATPSLSQRDRVMRARTLAMHPRERLAAMQRLIDDAWALLQRNPTGLDHFLRRNYKARSIARPSERSSDGA